MMQQTTPARSARRRAAKAALLAGALTAGVAVSLGGCGRQGPLVRPAPLFGERARSDYDARRAAASQPRESDRTAGPAAADAPDPGADNAPRTTRDIPDPHQSLTPASRAPIEGIPDVRGVPPSLTPPN